ncbi:hypothetical protein [Pseudomonas citronellolis]|uniref:hypothetical protein n=1 Tax=Pseudomonas citronellolis TaxID=53408 RepID=UPI0023E45744|nr:hypothetical protein [Pseudomonas citronellolis]MDF3933333.1 hypothetical protein [Pseudomonas citronellolis]
MTPRAPALLALCASLCLPSLAAGATLSFNGSVVAPPCRADALALQDHRATLLLPRCASPALARLSEPSGAEPARRLEVTDEQGRPLDLDQGLALDRQATRVRLHDLDDRRGARPLLLNIEYL